MIRTGRLLPALLLGTLALLGTAPRAHAVVPQDEGESEEEIAEEEAESEEEEEGTAWFALVGADVHAGTGEVLRGATVLAKDGKIAEIGYDLYLPEGTEVLDATGLRAYPGIVAISATQAITTGGNGAVEPPDHEHVDVHALERAGEAPAAGLTPSDEAPDASGGAEARELEAARPSQEDSFDPFSSYLVLALSSGITTVEQGGAAVKLKRGEFEGVFLSDGFFETITWTDASPASKRSARENFRKAAAYLRELRAWERAGADEDTEPKKSRGVDSGALAVLKGEKRARFQSNDREDLVGIAHLAQEFGFRPVVIGGVEAWTVADELGRAGATVVVTPRSRRDKDEELVRPGGSTIENAAILHEHGVQVALIPSNTSIDLGGIMGRDLLHIAIEAAFAVRGGLSQQAALEGITIVPARLMEISHRVGSIEVGKDCDLVVTDGDLLHYETLVQYTVVEGEVVYDKSEELFFAHIRPREPAPDEPDEGREPEESEEPAPEEEGAGADEPGGSGG